MSEEGQRAGYSIESESMLWHYFMSQYIAQAKQKKSQV